MIKLGAQISSNELAVLRVLATRKHEGPDKIVIEISEINLLTGIKSNEETQRALYILEGKNFAEPVPAADLTSKKWQVTDLGLRALSLIENEK